MKKFSVGKCLDTIKCLNEKVTLLGIGPLSKTIVEASIESALENDFPVFFIASRNQIDNECGYVESWDQYAFNSYVEGYLQDINYKGLVYNCRDHGGPWQKDEEYAQKISHELSLDNCFNSFFCDIDAGFDLLHIDTSKDPNYKVVPHKLAVERIVEIVTAIEEYKTKNSVKEIPYEVSLEETNGECSAIEDFNEFVGLLIKSIDERRLPRPAFMVGNTGTLTRMGKNVGKFNPEIVCELKNITDNYGLILKEHNTDYLDTSDLLLHPELGIGMANVAPEFGNLETEALMELYKLEEQHIKDNELSGLDKSNIIPLIYSEIKKSNKWKKWLDNKSFNVDLNTDTEFLELIISINGHYFYNNNEIVKARGILYENIKNLCINSDPHKYVKDYIKKGIQRYVDAFNLKGLTSKLYEYEKFEGKRSGFTTVQL
ncbi:MAG: D-tagatose-1,6-bisphosphate aldolase subunit KbaZ [Firmicutes bacterium ADurb.Bin419]|nr:MAG: D-tagatose-1,6-bisphosphate aldolase subunit KbaZ [Firmicutes bacterium ADurb.Bin419]